MNSFKIYNQIVSRAKSRAKNKQEANVLLGYNERHHIIPKCMGGADIDCNICYLTAREHFIAHFLLTKMYPSNHKLMFACHRLAEDKNGFRIKSSRIYEIVRQRNSIERKKLNKYNCEWIKRQSEKMTGRTKENNDSVRRMSETKKGKTKENNDSVRRMSETKKGRTKENHIGTYNQSQKMTGRTKETHPGLKVMSEKKSKLSLDTKIKLVELKDSGYSMEEIKFWVNENFPEYVEVSISGLYKSIANTRKYLKNNV